MSKSRQTVYAHHNRAGDFFCDIHSSEGTLSFCGKGTIWKLEVRPVKEGEESPYWGWWDNERQQYEMIFARKILFEMCFTYGYQVEERRSKGKAVNLMIVSKKPLGVQNDT